VCSSDLFGCVLRKGKGNVIYYLGDCDVLFGDCVILFDFL